MSETTDLRSEIQELRERVSELERELVATNNEHEPYPSNGLDSRDSAVLAVLQHGKSYTGQRIARLYTRETDIRRMDTAKDRAKALTKRDCFQREGRRFVYRGE